MPMMLLAALAMTPPSACETMPIAAADAACIERRLAALRTALPHDVENSVAGGVERADDARVSWSWAARSTLELWIGFRQARCDAALLRFEGVRENAGACRLRIGRTILADFRFRYDSQPGGLGRKDVETRATFDSGKGPEEEGPCAKVVPAECDYCAMNHCWDARRKADDAALNRVWRTALARIAARPALTPAQRADWTRRLRTAQRLWMRWRDENCPLEQIEAPNPSAHSNYALIVGPCLTAETEARTAILKRTYGR